LSIAFLFCGNALVSAVPDEEGLYAVIRTEFGEFTVSLAFEKAPRTVANFVGLAEGEKTWLDLTNGNLRNDKFYNGITFHRIISNFVIQGGSPNGLGNDGPGYRFKDEFHPDLRHDKAGILSMANSGAHTNGSQFFVTLAPQPHLDDKHSVFGEVVEGMDRVLVLGQIPTAAPGTKPVIHTIDIVRVGAAAEAFGLGSLEDPLPDVVPADVSMVRTATGNFELHWQADPSAIEYLFATENLVDWSGAILTPTGRISMDNFVATRQMVFVKIMQGKAD
jgi:cyclophilin family peptidyl-prolyl cis-trans isomerase